MQCCCCWACWPPQMPPCPSRRCPLPRHPSPRAAPPAPRRKRRPSTRKKWRRSSQCPPQIVATVARWQAWILERNRFSHWLLTCYFSVGQWHSVEKLQADWHPADRLHLGSQFAQGTKRVRHVSKSWYIWAYFVNAEVKQVKSITLTIIQVNDGCFRASFSQIIIMVRHKAKNI